MKPLIGDYQDGSKVTIYMSYGYTAGDVNDFVISSDGTIRYDKFIYNVTKGSVDYSYFESIVE